MGALILIAVIFLGLAFGSFASVIIHRLHKGQGGIFTGRSKCPKCQTTLGAKDLIPLVSYVAFGHHCRHCNKKISVLYPLLEATMAGFFVLTTLLVGVENVPSLIFYLLITFVFVTISFYDGLFQEIPDSVILPTILIAGPYIYLAGPHTAASMAIGLLIPVLFFGFLFFVSKGQWLGGGDVRIGALMGVLLGWPNILVGLFLGYLIGSIWSAGGMLVKKLNRKSQIPFAPFLFLGTYIAMFWGTELMDWYMKLVVS